jgi:hypothetical protein
MIDASSYKFQLTTEIIKEEEKELYSKNLVFCKTIH